jgi:hypothetical protein
LGNTINMAGKDRLLISNLLYQISEFIPKSPIDTTSYKNNILKKIAEQQLESNMMALKNGGNISNIQLQPIPGKFVNGWNSVYEKWIGLKIVLA